ncbi:MAG: Lpg1974 family pore-forming outer membrane protein [Pseudomonadota bacterium]
MKTEALKQSTFLSTGLLVGAGVAIYMATATSAKADDIVTEGMFIGIKGQSFQPHFEADIATGNQNSGPLSDLEIFSFDWDQEAAWRAWIGFERADGLGVSIGHFSMSGDTSLTVTDTGPDFFEIDFDPDSDDIELNLIDGESFIIQNELDVDATDIEFWQKHLLNNTLYQFGAGLRFGRIDRRYFAQNDTRPGEFAFFDHEFRGVGPSINYGMEIPIAHSWAIFASGRASILYGEHDSSYQERATDSFGRRDERGFVSTMDSEIGVQWRGAVGQGELTLRASLDSQVWFGGGGWDLYDDDMGAQFPQDLGNFGLFGYGISAQYKVATDGIVQSLLNPDDAPAITNPGFFAGAEYVYATPYFQSDIFGADEGAGGNPLNVLSFDWNGESAYRAWAGYENQTGTSLQLSYFSLSGSQSESELETAGRSLQAHFDPDTEDIDIFISTGDSLGAETKLDLDVIEVDLRQEVLAPNSNMQFGFGIRHTDIDRSLFVFDSGSIDTDNGFFQHEFNGWGPTIGYEADFLITEELSFYNRAKAGVVFGEHKSNYREDVGPFPQSGSFSNNEGLNPILDLGIGFEWNQEVGNSGNELTLYAGIEAIVNFNGGGWDLYDDDGGAQFPQQTGGFALQGFTFGANYKFNSSDSSVEKRIVREETGDPGFFAGAEFVYLTPYFENDVVGADQSFGPNDDLEVFSFDWSGAGGYRGYVGYENGYGTQAQLTYFNLDASTSFSRAEGTGQIEVHFDPDSDDADIFVNGTLLASNSLELDVFDLELSQQTMIFGFDGKIGGGLRYATIDRNLFAFESGGTEFIHFDHEFEGWGPSVNYEVIVPIHDNLSLYNNGRATVLFGEHESRYTGENTDSDTGINNSNGFLPTIDAQIGLQWDNTDPDTGTGLTVNVGLEAQAWINGGGWDLYRDDGGARFPQQLGSFGLIGFSSGAQLKF